MQTETRICKTCGIEKPLLSDFNSNGSGRRRNSCKACESAKQRAKYMSDTEKYRARNKENYAKNRTARRAGAVEYYAENRDSILAANKRYREQNGEQIAARMRRYRADLKCEMIEAYGGKCSCCGEAEPAFLTIEHTRGDGAEHRRMLGSFNVYNDLKSRGWPKDGFDLLCFNCNCATSGGKICPHKLKS